MNPVENTVRSSSARGQLLEAAQSLFWESGVDATSPRQVLDRSGIGQGSLYHHFPTKRDLAIAAITSTATSALDSARLTLRAPAGTGIDRLIAYLRRDRDALAGCRVGRLTSDQTVMADGGLIEPVEEYFAGLIDSVTEVLRESGLPDTVARTRAITAVAVIQGGYVLSRALGDSEILEQAVDGFIELLPESANDGNGQQQ
jgi:AcrR family transcriptional regulator